VVRSALLLAESESELRAYLERNLSGDGFDVIEAARSGEALDLAEQRRPALIVADDPDLCRRLREGSPGRRWDRDVPVSTALLHPSRRWGRCA
jgi:DNA-binding response OmpR family regulator